METDCESIASSGLHQDLLSRVRSHGNQRGRSYPRRPRGSRLVTGDRPNCGCLDSVGCIGSHRRHGDPSVHFFFAVFFAVDFFAARFAWSPWSP
jgi:hypothetical protein